MELPNDIWVTIVNNSKKTLQDFMHEANTLKKLNKIRKMILLQEEHLIKEMSMNINSFDVLELKQICSSGRNGYYLVRKRHNLNTSTIHLIKLIETEQSTAILNLNKFIHTGVDIARDNHISSFSIKIKDLFNQFDIISHIKQTTLQAINTEIAMNLQKYDIVEIINAPFSSYKKTYQKIDLSTTYAIFIKYGYNKNKQISRMILHIFWEDTEPIFNGICPLNNFCSIIRIVKFDDIKKGFVGNIIKTFIIENNILI